MNRSLNRASCLFLLLLYIFPITYLMAESFNCTLDRLTPVWLLLLCLAAWISADFRHGIFIGLPTSLLLLYLIYRNSCQLLSEQLKDVFDKMVGAYYEHFYAVGKTYTFADAVPDHSLVFLLLAFLLAFYLATALTSGKGRILFALIGTVPPFFFSLAVTGLPNPALILCLMLFLTLLLVSGERYDPGGAASRAIPAVLVPTALLLGLMLLPFGPERYEFDQEDARTQELHTQLRSAMHRFANELRERIGLFDEATDAAPSPPPVSESSGSVPAEDMDLALPYDFEHMDETVLSVWADTGGYVYLRGRSYGDYAGTCWKEAEEAPFGPSLSFSAYAAEGGDAHEMEIRLVEDLGDVLYAPYFNTLPSSSDSYILSEGRKNYRVDYVLFTEDPPSASLPDAYRAAELSYREYAHAYFTRLPSQTKTAMEHVLQQAGLSADSPQIVREVAEYVQSAGVYDLHTEAYPSSDYALYFLTAARRGYCIHFATAAAVLYRALGIPARVTEGYLFTASPDRYTDVVRANAHTWVELYYDGLGWVPVEVTGIGNLFPQEENGGEEAEASHPPVESPQPDFEAPGEENALPSPSPAATERPQPSPTPEPVFVGTATEDPPPVSPGVNRTLRAIGRALRVLIPLCLALSILPLRRVLLLGLTRRRMEQSDLRKAAIAVWKAAGKVSAYGAAIPDGITRCAEKAAFSRHDISPQELAACRALLEEMRSDVYHHLSPSKKLIFKYIQCII